MNSQILLLFTEVTNVLYTVLKYQVCITRFSIECSTCTTHVSSYVLPLLPKGLLTRRRHNTVASTVDARKTSLYFRISPEELPSFISLRSFFRMSFSCIMSAFYTYTCLHNIAEVEFESMCVHVESDGQVRKKATTRAG